MSGCNSGSLLLCTLRLHFSLSSVTSITDRSLASKDGSGGYSLVCMSRSANVTIITRTCRGRGPGSASLTPDGGTDSLGATTT